jgi:HK97 family phage prohead protease
MEADFSGYATKAGLKCSDGRTIMPGAFKHQDSMKVPLVWQHGHKDPENVLGHAILENRDDGVYAYGFFNKTEKAEQARQLLEHGDINMMSIWANQLVERSKQVFHGAIREVSLVLSGANPGALIENVTIRHSDGMEEMLDEDAIIYTGLELEHAARPGGAAKAPVADEDDDGETIKDVYDSLTDKQKDVVHFMIGEAIESVKGEAAHSELDVDALEDVLGEISDKIDAINEKGEVMAHNVFESSAQGGKKEVHVLSHDAISGIVQDAMKSGSLREAVEAYAEKHLEHGIEDIDVLFPDAVAIDNVPEYLKRRTEWVAGFLGAARKTPFSRIKTVNADITTEQARAKGYIKGNLKKEEFFRVAKRTTTPTTVYKKQKLDRDDMIDITDFDVVAWLKAEMRVMLDEEVARAALIGDGRDISDDDKINEQNIRPIASDHELYVTTINVNLGDANSSVSEFVDAVVSHRHLYKGTGLPTMFTTETMIARFMLLKDTLNRRIYKSLDELATELRVAAIVPVEVMEETPDILAIFVNPVDYVFGATRGGEVSMFDDFDIDYNQHKYLIETRLCGALTKLKSALVVRSTAGTNVLVAPAAPTFDEATGALTITDQTGVVYKNSAGATINAAGSPYTVDPGDSETVTATPASGYYFASSENDEWTFTADA